MLIFNESDLAKIAEINSSHASIIPFAFERTFGSDDIMHKLNQFSCLIKHGSSQSHSAFAIARYFSAPDRGQFFLSGRWVTQGLMVINGSQDLRFVSWLRITMKRISANSPRFSVNEKALLLRSVRKVKTANATINLISKSNAKEYMPDLLIGFGKLGAGNSSFVNRRKK